MFAYAYPSLERKSLESRINQELPFATINMSAISGSMVDPTQIFQIIISTSEYPYLKKEFTNNSYKNDIKLIDIIMFSTTIQAGVGLTNLFPNSFNSKLVTIIQQMTMICSYVIILYIITKKF